MSELTAGGYEQPRNTQFSVFLDNRVGKLRDLVDCLAGQSLTLAGLSVVDSTDHAVVRLLTSRAELARRLLNRHGLAFSEIEMLVVELAGPRTLVEVCQVLLRAELSVHYAYPLLVRPRGLPTLALHTDDVVLATQLLRRKMFTLLAENDLGENATGGLP